MIDRDRIVLRNVKGETVLIGVKIGNLYRALVREESQDLSANNTEATLGQPVNTDLVLWHERLAHVNRGTIAKMKKYDAVIGLENVNVQGDPKSTDCKVINCESCCLAVLPNIRDSQFGLVPGQELQRLGRECT